MAGFNKNIDGGYVTVDKEWLAYRVQMDEESVYDMVRKAAKNKGGKCRDGALLVEIVRRKTLPIE